MDKSPATLEVVSPNHGRVEYKWEWKRAYMKDWEVVEVLLWTCLLYVDAAGQYRCTVGDSTVIFHVQGLYKHSTVMNFSSLQRGCV